MFPKYLVKRMFLPGKSLFVVKKAPPADDAEYLMFKGLNVITPLELPIPGMEQFSLNQLQSYAKIEADGKPFAVTEDRFLHDLEFWFQGKMYTGEYLTTLRTGHVDTFIIPVGATSTLLLRIREDIAHLAVQGDHTFAIDLNFHGFTLKFAVTLDLPERNCGLIFDPEAT
jgi:hypothetical protein